MRDAVLALVVIAVLVFLDRREERGGRSNPLRKPWQGNAEDAPRDDAGSRWSR